MSNRAMRRAVARSNHQFLTQMDFSSLDAAEELMEKTGIRLNFGEPFDRVEEQAHAPQD